MSVPLSYSQQMLAIVELWQQSGLSKKAFCVQEQITYHRFHYWHQRYKIQQTSAAGGTAFIHLALPSTTASAELIYPDGRRIVFHQGVDAAYLKALLG